MNNYCSQCGRQLFGEGQICFDCAVQAKQHSSQPFAPPTQHQSPYQTQPLGQPPMTQPMQIYQAAQNMQTNSQCPHCGGAGGIFTKTTITPGGFIYMGIMLVLTFFFLMIFFPCALIPFGLLFLGLLFKEKHFACINCGQKVY